MDWRRPRIGVGRADHPGRAARAAAVILVAPDPAVTRL